MNPQWFSFSSHLLRRLNSPGLDYEIVKTTALRAYELMPEAYRQKFRSCKKSPDCTFMEFAREKATLFDRWCTATKATDFSSLRELVLPEEFKNNISIRIVTYLNEQKVMSLSQAAVLADEFVLTHKPALVFSTSPTTQFHKSIMLPLRSREERSWTLLSWTRPFNCCQPRIRNHPPPVQQPKGVGLASTVSGSVTVMPNVCVSDLPDPSYKPFILSGLMSLTGDLKDQQKVQILRDTGRPSRLSSLI